MQEKHIFSAGSSGGGKTTRLRERHALHDGISVFVGHTEEPDRSFDGQVCHSLGDMINAVRQCPTTHHVRNLRIIYRPTVKEGPESLREVKRFVRMVADHFNAGICVQIIVDECQHIIPDNEDVSSYDAGNELTWLFHESRDLNGKVVASTQDPTEVYYPPIKNCRWFEWCGKMKTWHKGWARAWGFNKLALPDQAHRFAIIDPGDPPKVVYRGETDPNYA